MTISTKMATLAVHAGVRPHPVTGAIAPDISMAANYASRFGDIGFSAEGTQLDKVTYAYAREGHPNGRQLEEKLSALEGGEDAVVFASGIAAISGLLLHLLDPGDHVVFSDISYAGAAEFARGLLKRKGIIADFADMSDLADVKAKVIKGKTRLLYAETPCNPVLKLADIAGLAAIAKNAGAKLAIDSTFASPVITRPLALGADYVLHSLTKYIGGHGDALGGAVIGTRPAMTALREEVVTHLGAAISPFNAWLILRGIETLPIRMAAYSQTALTVAEFLSSHPVVTGVRYPHLPSHPQYDLARKQMALGSGMIAFTVKDQERFGRGLEGALRIFKYAASLGHSHSLILHCDTGDLQRTTFKLDEAALKRYRAFAGDGFFRLSIGLEDANDLCQDLKRALDAAA
ncbi:MAG TPA: PLP-dependent aspartate aminotransferase family protein [Nordella sp.]|nr:PLP-dependent aspartate aminotransferase family protein [Nordella sp.]